MSRSPEDFDKHAKDMILAQEVPPGVKQTALWLYQHERSKVKPTAHNDERVLASVLAWIDEQRLLIKWSKKNPTPEDRRRLQMLAEGMSEKQIAHALGQNVGTTRAYFTRLRARLGMDTLYQLMAIAVERGWVKLKDDRPRKHQ